MISLNHVFYLLVIICTIHLQYGNGAIQELRGYQRFKEGFLFVGKNSFNEGNLIFAVCDKNTTSTTLCNVVQKVYPNKNSEHSCLINLKGDNEESDLDISIGIATLGKDKAILYWSETYNNLSTTNIGTVNLKTCKMNQVKIPDPENKVLMELYYTDKLVTYDDDSFDIFVNDSKRYGNKLGKMSINGDGTAKGQPIASNITGGLVHYVSSIATRSPVKGYAYLKGNDKDYTLSIVKPDGTDKQLEKYDNAARPIVSASKNVVSACTKRNADSDVNCTQYDEDGNIKFSTTIVDQNKNIHPKALYNFANGGLLVMLAESSPSKEYRHRMIKIDADGKIMGTAFARAFDDFSSKYKTTYVYKYNDLEYCGIMIAVNPTTDEQRPSDYEIFHYCVNEDDFTK